MENPIVDNELQVPNPEYQGLYVSVSNNKNYVRGSRNFVNGFLRVKTAKTYDGIWAEVSTHQAQLPENFRVPCSDLYYVPKSYNGILLKPKADVVAVWKGILWKAQIVRVRGLKVDIKWIGKYSDYDSEEEESLPANRVIPFSILVVWDGQEWE